MIRDPSDGSVREAADVRIGAKALSENRYRNQNNGLIPTSGLPLESTKPKDQAKLDKSRKFLKEYFKRNPEQGV